MPRMLPWLQSPTSQGPTSQGLTLPLPAEDEDPFASDSDTDEVIDLTQDDEPWALSGREA